MSRLKTAPESFRDSATLSPRASTSFFVGTFSFQSYTKSNGPKLVSNPASSSFLATSVAVNPFVPKYITRYVLYPMFSAGVFLVFKIIYKVFKVGVITCFYEKRVVCCAVIVVFSCFFCFDAGFFFYWRDC